MRIGLNICFRNTHGARDVVRRRLWQRSTALHGLQPSIVKNTYSTAATNSSGERLVTIPESRLEELFQAEVQYLATVPVRAVSMHEVLDALDPRRAAKFIQADVPKRIAVRIRMIESLSCWHRVPELVEIHGTMSDWYKSLRLVQRNAEVGLTDFTSCVNTMRLEGKNLVSKLTKGVHKFRQITVDEYDDAALNKWMDGFLLSRIGSNMLLDQYRACVPKAEGGLGRETGIIDIKCNVGSTCTAAAKAVSQLCLKETGKAPPFKVETCHWDKSLADSPIVFSYIPGYLRYILVELLKNSFNATVKNSASAEEARSRPVHILVSTDESRVVIRVSDRAGGIPCEVGDRIWSYLYGAAAFSDQAATPLAGYGVGLPLSRLHARYLGGDLEIRSFPGFGTDAYLILPRISAEQVEYLG